MQRWEYCEVTWNPDKISCSICSAHGLEKRSLETSSWEQLLANLGSDGWEMISMMPSPKQQHEYFFYFKRHLSSPYDPTLISTPPPPPNPYR